MTKKLTLVAAYARVSCGKDAMLHSLSAQVNYYSNLWTFCGVYADEAKTGTKDSRENFQSLIEDCKAGKIDLIITKSNSRFARNTVTLLNTIRELKSLGVEVYFEKENIYTLDSKGELLITIMSSLAQEESRSISENVTWGQRKRFADGKVTLPYKNFLGYKKGEDGLPEIVPKEAETVRDIYKMFIEGKTVNAIANYLMSKNILSPSGKQIWRTSTIESILTNEKYKGSAILQKKFTVDFLQKKMKVNEGEVPQYKVEESHPAIIQPEEWELVQPEMKRRKASGKHHNSLSPFSAKIVCGDCGEFYGSKVWHSTSKYKRTIWQCNNKFKGEKKCMTPHLHEEDIQKLFMRALSKLLTDRTALIEDCELMCKTLLNFKEIEIKSNKLLEEMNVVSELVKKLISENSDTPMNQDDYIEKYDSYTNRFNKAKEQYTKLQKTMEQRQLKADTIKNFINEIPKMDNLPIEFNERLWNSVIDTVTVYEDERIVFKFKNGIEIEEVR